MRRNQKNQGGQALLMVTMGLFAMCGLMGLAIDLGWSFYVHKTAQAAADSAALGAVKAAYEALTVKSPPFTCSSQGVTCQSGLENCSNAAGNLSVGCQFAQQNGFSSGGNNGRQSLRIEADAPVSACGQASPPNCIPTAPGVAAFYWVHVVATETIPQLFSAIYGNTNAVVSADATAALANVVLPGSVYATNRLPGESFLVQKDSQGRPILGPSNDAGVDIAISHGSQIDAPGGGVFLASNCPGSPACGNIGGNQMAGAGLDPLSNTVTGTTYLRAGGDAAWCDVGASCQKGAPASMFGDPFSGLGQPPIANTAFSPHPVKGGTITTAGTCGGGACPSGTYFAVDTNNQPTGLPVQIGTGVTFNGGNFGTFVFAGGMVLNSIQGNTVPVNLGPGEYIVAGVNPALSGSPIGLSLYTNSVGVTGGNGSDAGRLFIATDFNYPGMTTIRNALNGLGLVTDNFKFPEVSIPSDMANSWYGLNPDSTDLPDSLKPFGPLAFWQDQQNSVVQYDLLGNVKNSTSCGGDGGDAACVNTSNKISGKTNEPQFRIFTEQSPASSGNLNIHGVIYQPRGGSMKFDAGVIFNSDSTLVSGTIDIGGPGTHLNLPRASRIPLSILRPVMVH